MVHEITFKYIFVLWVHKTYRKMYEKNKKQQIWRWFYIGGRGYHIFSVRKSFSMITLLLHNLFFAFFVSLQLGVNCPQKLLRLSCKTISKVRFLVTTLRISLKKEKSLFRGLTYFILHKQTSRSSLSYQFADFLTLFISAPCFNAGAKAPLLEPKILLMTLGKTRN